VIGESHGPPSVESDTNIFEGSVPGQKSLIGVAAIAPFSGPFRDA
jgi:hypothetical protein